MDTLSQFDGRTAAGLLARAALSISDAGNPASKPILKDENKIRAELLDRACKEIGVDPRSNDPEVLERLGDYFDALAEKVAESPNYDAAIHRLIEYGTYPSDLYSVEIIPNIKTALGRKYPREEQLIRRTVVEPGRMQHFGPPKRSDEPFLVSLFSRRFVTPYPFKDFTMLVAAQRGEDRKLNIHQAWRLYDSKVPHAASGDLVDSLRRFADVYGEEIELNGVRGRFFLTSESLAPHSIGLSFKGKPREITVTQFAQAGLRGGGPRAALIVAIDLDKYRATLSELDTEDIR